MRPELVAEVKDLTLDQRHLLLPVVYQGFRREREIKAAFPEVSRVFVEAKDRNVPSQTETPV